MERNRRAPGLTIIELLAALLVVAMAVIVAVPTIAGAKGSSGVQQSMANIANLGVAHVLYALDWDMRQVTWVKDDLGAFNGSVAAYNAAAGGCSGYPFPDACQPPAVAGWGCEGYGPFAYWSSTPNIFMLQPMNFPDTPGTCSQCAAWGTFRVPNLKSLHDYVNGRYHDPVYFAPNDTSVIGPILACLTAPCEFNNYNIINDDCNPAWSSYAMSPAAMFHHDVMRSNAAGGWQAPWTIDHGYQAPGLFQAAFPQLKTLMIEHSWVQNPPAPCNPAFYGCEPYYFNMGIDSSPVTLFYDLSVRLLPNTEAYAADQQVLRQTGGVDGLWNRGTSLGSNGYVIDSGYDGTPLSHHILTTDGILGRDTLTGAQGSSIPVRSAQRVKSSTLPPPKSAVPVERRRLRFTPPVSADP